MRAKRAGFDGVELHGAHGYLFTQFLSAEQNRRTDAWGGPLENRARLLRDALRAVRARVGPSFTVGVRLSPENFGNAKGLDLDESVQTARWLAEDGADFVHLSLWRALEPTAKRPAEHALPLFRAALPPDVAILAAGASGRAPRPSACWRWAPTAWRSAARRSSTATGRCARRDAAWQPRRPPVTMDDLRAEGLERGVCRLHAIVEGVRAGGVMFGIQHFWLFVVSGLLLNITPGQDTLYIVTRSVAQGRRAGLWSVLGISTGSIVHTLAAAFGLSAILATSASAFTVVKFAGAAYLVFLGVKMLLERPRQPRLASIRCSGTNRRGRSTAPRCSPTC